MQKHKKRAIIKLVLASLIVAVALFFALVPFDVPFTNYKYTSFAGGIKLGIDLKGGIYAVYDIADDEPDRTNLDTRLDGTVTRLHNMITSKGYMEATVSREGDTRIRVEVPDLENPKELFEIIGEPATLEFRIESETVLTGDTIKDAYAAYTNEHGYVVQLIFDSLGAKKFGEITQNNIGKAMEIVVNGQTISSPSIQSAITDGRPIITGSFTYESADKLANQIVSGAFDVKLALIESSVVSPTLGVNALTTSLIACAIGLIGIIIFLCVLYRAMGAMSTISLLLFVSLYLFFLWALPWVQLTLPGIAGIILSIGMAVDANIIIFERIKDEYKLGKSINASVIAGFRRSLSAIIDANVTTIIAAIILIAIGSGSVRGFGITWLIGVIISMFCSLVITRALLKNMLKINKNNPALYNLKREDDVIEIPDEDEDTDKKDSRRGLFPFGKKKENRNKQPGGAQV
ncbi:MAG TPA: protein translocase subunit SecD [Clostridiales bacterium]|nr:protein translocase subunit SecD [Clostridiales bacterium]